MNKCSDNFGKFSILDGDESIQFENQENLSERAGLSKNVDGSHIATMEMR
jgi:hypothetical protein